MRKLATAAAVSLALASGGVFGLGLGEIEMRSALNQPMDAEIRLTSVQPGELEGMIVQLASEDAFARAGIERSQVLTDLDFTVDTSSGTPVIRISSSRPVVEPFLNFLLEVDWPQGRMVREYTVLLDPPVFMTPSAAERNDTADTPVIVQRGEESLVVPTPIQRETSTDQAAQSDGELVVLDSVDEVSDSQLLTEATDANASSADEGEVVSLTDLAAPNTQAEASRNEAAVAAFDLDDIEVVVEGNIEEVSDDVFINQDGEVIRQNTDRVAGELVELDEFENGSAAELSNDLDGSSIVSLDDLATEQAGDASNGNQNSNATEVAVASGDTLFEIAQTNAAPGVSVQQMMLALLAANESSFINNNINLVRAGAILRIPDANEASRLTQTQALAAIGEQNQLWQEYRDSLRATNVTQVAEVEPSEPSEPSEDIAADEAAAVTEPVETAALDEESAALEGLSEEARAILENARNEVLDREELRIVADNETSSSTASATADETGDKTAERLGDVNRQLQLTREELSAANLRTTDLDEQVAELDGTAENLDSLVTLRQNEIARLEAQLADVRDSEAAAEQEALASVADDAAAAADDAAAVAGDAAGDAADAAGDAAGNVVAGAGEALDGAAKAVESEVSAADDAASEAVDSLTDSAADTLAGATDSVETVADSGTNALLEAGETLGEVELLSPETEETPAAQSEAETEAAATEQKTWFQNFLEDPKRMMIAGIGALGLLGVLGTLLFRRKRKEPEDALLGATAVDEFESHATAESDMQAASGSGAIDTDVDGRDGSGAFGVAAAGAAGAAAIGAASMDDSQARNETHNQTADDFTSDGTMAFEGASMHDLPEDHPGDDSLIDDDLDKDDTISEADVYLAYGLHGQAEELLGKAIERNPNNEAYLSKLLETHHAQNNVEEFHENAQQFQARFGGSSNPAWGQIAAMGLELNPNDALYSSVQSSVQESVSAIDGSANADSVDFVQPDLSSDSAGSTQRDLSAGDDAAVTKEDEADLLDHSLDPAFAFDEGDLEATGDFSAIADELATENEDGSLEFPGLENVGTAANETMEAELPGMMEMEEPLSLDELDGLGESVDDLTLDLDQLSGDLDLDSAELLNSDLSDLDIPELTAENDLFNDETGGELDGSGDEMETMMDLAKAYIDMGDKDSASSTLGEIVKSGSPEQVTEAETLLRKIS